MVSIECDPQRIVRRREDPMHQSPFVRRPLAATERARNEVVTDAPNPAGRHDTGGEDAIAAHRQAIGSAIRGLRDASDVVVATRAAPSAQ
jgi:hypothetical protein